MNDKARPIDLNKTYVQLRASGEAKVWKASAFWEAVMGSGPEDPAAAEGLLVSSYEFTENWPHWEMHPAGDELVSVLSGELLFVIENAEGNIEVPLQAGESIVIPRGKWHWAKIKAPVRALFVTQGQGTQYRPTETK